MQDNKQDTAPDKIICPSSHYSVRLWAVSLKRETSFNFQDLDVTVETAQRDISRKKKLREGGVGVESSLSLSPLFFPLSYFAPHSTIRGQYVISLQAQGYGSLINFRSFAFSLICCFLRLLQEPITLGSWLLGSRHDYSFIVWELDFGKARTNRLEVQMKMFCIIRIKPKTSFSFSG